MQLIRNSKMRLAVLLLCVLVLSAEAQRLRRPRRQHSRRQVEHRRRSAMPRPPGLRRTIPELPVACPERLSLEDREERANLIFTGRIEWLPGGRNRVTRHIVGGEGVAGGVRVKRVLKGRRDVAGRLVEVLGLGGDEVCNSHARVRDTKIFLTYLDETNRVHLNSSLIRLTLRNLRKITKAVQGECGVQCCGRWQRGRQQAVQARDACAFEAGLRGSGLFW